MPCTVLHDAHRLVDLSARGRKTRQIVLGVALCLHRVDVGHQAGQPHLHAAELIQRKAVVQKRLFRDDVLELILHHLGGELLLRSQLRAVKFLQFSQTFFRPRNPRMRRLIADIGKLRIQPVLHIAREQPHIRGHLRVGQDPLLQKRIKETVDILAVRCHQGSRRCKSHPFASRHARKDSINARDSQRYRLPPLH